MKAIWAMALAVMFPLLAVVLAHIARSEIRQTGERGDRLAKAALIIGYPVCALWLVVWMAIFLSIAFSPVSS